MSLMKLDKMAAVRFLTDLFRSLAHGMYLELRFIPRNGGPAVQQFISSIADVGWLEARRLNRLGYTVAFSAALRSRRGGGSDDVGWLFALWADVDAKQHGGSKEAALAALHDLDAKLPPSIIVDSGNGYHGYWLLSQPVEVTAANRRSLTSLLERLQSAVGSDPVHDLARVMRLPGSINAKDPNSPKPCRILEETDHRYTLAEVEAALDCPSPHASRREGMPDAGRPIDRVLALLQDTRPRGKGWKALCPGHDDHTPSLDVWEIRSGEVRMKCWAGCSTERVLSALELTRKDLQGSTGKPSRSEEGALQRQRLVDIGSEADLFQTDGDEAWATYTVGGRRRTTRISESGFREWLFYRYQARFHTPPVTWAVNDAVATLAAKAKFEGPGRVVHLRVAEGDDGTIYIDCADSEGHVIKVTPAGWAVIDDPPVLFWRPPNSAPLPLPERGGRISDLQKFLNLGSKEDFVLAVAWLLTALRPGPSYPVLILLGERGSAKSTAAKMLRSLVDAVHRAASRGLPGNERDLAIAVRNNHILSFANVSRLSEPISDALCRIATDEGFATRELYSDDKERVFGGARPIMLNGIATFHHDRGDLLDRSVVLYLPRISPDRLRDDTKLWREFDEARPRILGALLDAMVIGLRRMPRIRLRHSPRMRDFAQWSVACEPGLHMRPMFLGAYNANQASVLYDALSHSLLAVLLRRFVCMERWGKGWSGTATELLDCLSKTATDIERRSPDWPRDATRLSSLLRRIAPNLRTAGIEVEFRREGASSMRMICLRGRPKASAEASSASAGDSTESQNPWESHDETQPRRRSDAPDAPSDVKKGKKGVEGRAEAREVKQD